jgi:hypothetical protein
LTTTVLPATVTEPVHGAVPVLAVHETERVRPPVPDEGVTASQGDSEDATQFEEESEEVSVTLAAPALLPAETGEGVTLNEPKLRV